MSTILSFKSIENKPDVCQYLTLSQAGGLFGPWLVSHYNSFLTTAAMNLKFWLPSQLLYRVFLAKKKFPEKAIILSDDVVLPFVMHCFIYLLYSLTCIFIVLCCFLMLKLKLLTSSYFEKLWKNQELPISWFRFDDWWSHRNFW